MSSARLLPLSLGAVLSLLSCGAPRPIEAPELVIEHATVLPGPYAPAIEDATIVVRNGLIVWVGKPSLFPPYRVRSDGTKILDAKGAVVTAGFWNAHVHFTEPHWFDASRIPTDPLNRQLKDMLLRFGFVNVVDTGSPPDNTRQLMLRIFAGELKGPRIVRAMGSFVPEGAKPTYVEDDLPELRDELQAERLVRELLTRNPDGIKLFAGTFLGGDDAGTMPPELIRVVSRIAHRAGRFVIAHPQHLNGIENALTGEVDILAHTAPRSGVWSAALVGRLADSVALVPTLQLWRLEAERQGVPAGQALDAQARGVIQLRSFFRAGGEVLFGTDVGYHQHYDPSEEYARMADAGMPFEAILASLTTSPTRHFDDAINTGTIRLGKRADLIILEEDPRENPAALANVRVTIRAGQILFERSQSN